MSGKLKRAVKYCFFLAIILSVQVAVYFVWGDPEEFPMESTFKHNRLFNLLFPTHRSIYILQFLGLISAFTSLSILNCKEMLCCTFLATIPLNPGTCDIVFSLTSLVFCIVTIAVTSSRNSIRSFFFIILTAVVSGLCFSIAVEMIELVIFAFFAILFYWLRNHNIGNDDGTAAPDAIFTVVSFMLCCGLTIGVTSKIYGFPEYSHEFWTPLETIKTAPFIFSTLALASTPCFFFTRTASNILLSFVCLISAEMFRFIPFSTPGQGQNLCFLVSNRLLDIGALAFVTGNHAKYAGIVCLIIYFTLKMLEKLFIKAL